MIPDDHDYSDEPTRRIRCRHRDGDPDCTCHPEEDEMDDTTLTAELEEIETLPAPLTAAQVTERELRRLETYKGAVLADPSDAKSARRLDEMRREVKGVRTTAARICKAEREEAVRIQREWVAVEKQIAERLEPVEDHLRDEAGRHDAWKAEEARKAEEDRREKIRIRVEDLVRLGAPLDMHAVETYDDAAWLAYLDQAANKVAARREAEARAARLTETGDECSTEEAASLTDDQYAHRLTVAQQAQREREELARIQAEEKAEAERKAKEEQARKDAEEAQRRADLERIAAEQQAENERLRRELEALQQPKPKPEPDDESALVRGICSTHDHEPEPAPVEVADDRAAAQVALDRQLDRAAEDKRKQRQEVATWAREVLNWMPSTPVVYDPDTLRRMRDTVSSIRNQLLDLENEMTETTVTVAMTTTTTQPTIH